MTTPAPASASAREWTAAAAVAAVLTAILTYPTVPAFFTGGRFDSGDGMFSIWNVAWIGHALITDPRHLLDANIFYPHTGTLAYSELNLVAGLFGLPVYVMTRNAVAALNSAVLIGFFLSFMCMWALVRRLTGSHLAALVSAAAFAFCPYVQAHTAHVQLLMTFVIPLLFLAFHRFADAPSWLRAATLGAALAVAGLASGYYGIFGGILLGAAALLFARRQIEYWLGLGVAVLTTGLLVYPVFAAFQRARDLVGGGKRSITEAESFAANGAKYLSSPSHLHGMFLHPATESIFPGLVVLAGVVAAVIGLVRATPRDRRVVASYLLLAAIGAWASLGPVAGLYTWIAKVMPVMTLLRAPERLGALVVFALAIVAAFGLRAFARRPAAALGLVAIVAVELAAVPWPLRPAPPEPDAYRLLATLPRGPVVEYLFNYKPGEFHRHERFMFASTYHWMPMVNGYSDVIPQDFVDVAVPINAFPDGPSFELMKRRGVRYVVWHLDDYQDPESRARLEARFPPYAKYLRQLTRQDDVWLYEIVGYPPSTAGQGGE